MVENMSEKKSPPRKGGHVRAHADHPRGHAPDIGRSTMTELTRAEAEHPGNQHSPPTAHDKSSLSKTPQPVKLENKGLKRKIQSPGPLSEDEAEKRSTPKRRRSQHGEGSPTPAGTSTPKTSNQRHMPLSERQQLAMVMQMTAVQPETQLPSRADVSPRPSSPHSSSKKTPIERKICKRNERGETLLHLAAKRGEIKETKKLIKWGADVNVKDFAGWTPLHEACIAGHLDVAKQLLRAGANVNVQGLENDTPLHDASINGHRKIVELLLRHGGNPVQTNSQGKSPLDCASDEDIEKLLRQELIASSSSSSSLDEVRSPTSPESNLSDKGEEENLLSKRLFDRDPSECLSSMISPPRITGGSSSDSVAVSTANSSLGLLSPLATSLSSTSSHTPHSSSSSMSPSSLFGSHTSHSTSLSPSSHTITSPHAVAPPSTTASSQSSIFKNLQVIRSMDKSSPRLMLRFQHIRREKERPPPPPEIPKPTYPTPTDPPYRSYSVTIDDYDKPFSPAESSTSQESDLYDPSVEITTYGSKRNIAGHAGGHGETAAGGGPAQLSSTVHTTGTPSHMSIAAPQRQNASSAEPPVVPVDSSSVLPCATAKPDSQMPTLAQERGPFEPFFENISDAEDEAVDLEVIDASQKPSSSSSPHQKTQSLRAPVPLTHIPALSPNSAGRQQQHAGLRTDVRTDVSSSSDAPLHSKQHTAGSGFRKDTLVPALSQFTCAAASLPSQSIPLSSSPTPPTTTTTLSHATESPHSEAVRKPSWAVDKLTPCDGDCMNEKTVLQNVAHVVDLSETLSNPGPTKTNEVSTMPARSESSRDSLNDTRPVSRTDKPRSERENSHSPKSDKDAKLSPRSESLCSPKPYKDNCGKGSVKPMSPKPERDRDSRGSRDSSDSPKSDREGGRPSSPKVPPLKIIMPSSKNGTTVDKHAEHLKVTSLPYVVNPTQEGGGEVVEGSAEGTVPMEVQDTPVTIISEPSNVPAEPVVAVISHHSSRASSVTSDHAPHTVNTDHGDTTTAVSSTQPEVTGVRTRRRAAEDITDNGSEKDGGSSRGSNKGEDSNDTRDSGGDKDRKEESQVQRRVTRSTFRSQQQNKKEDREHSVDKGSGKDETGSHKDEHESGTSHRNEEEVHVHPRKRKLRRQQQALQQQRDGDHSDGSMPVPAAHHHEKPSNPYELFLDIRKKVWSKRAQWLVVTPKAPQGFKDYLMVSCNYVLQNKASTPSEPMLEPPLSTPECMQELFSEQEKARHKLQIQHVIEREKLILSIEQEILRVHGRAARAMANQSTPLSVCSILKDEEIYNSIDGDCDDKSTARTRYNGRQLLSWLQDVDDKYEKIKEALLMRHHHEAESLHAVQKLEWEWKLRDRGLCDPRSAPNVDLHHVPMVHVNDEFDLLPTLP